MSAPAPHPTSSQRRPGVAGNQATKALAACLLHRPMNDPYSLPLDQVSVRCGHSRSALGLSVRGRHRTVVSAVVGCCQCPWPALGQHVEITWRRSTRPMTCTGQRGHARSDPFAEQVADRGAQRHATSGSAVVGPGSLSWRGARSVRYSASRGGRSQTLPAWTPSGTGSWVKRRGSVSSASVNPLDRL